ncbi:MAG: hypothetical protein Q8S13_10395, partial [Dehalococcoidia bacterium]|nr:hypothetical protein [Dehalococcoidia bacterium]
MTATRDRTPSRLEHFMREFWTGLTEPSGLAFLTTVASLLVAVAGALWFFSVPVLSGPLGKYLARSPKDTEAQATYRALQLSRDLSKEPQLLILGSSAIASGIDSEPALEKELEARTGQKWSVSLLATPLQTSLDQVTLTEVALGPPPGPRRPVVIAIEVGLIRERASLSRLLDLEQSGRLGLRSAWTDQAVREL